MEGPSEAETEAGATSEAAETSIDPAMISEEEEGISEVEVVTSEGEAATSTEEAATSTEEEATEEVTEEASSLEAGTTEALSENAQLGTTTGRPDAIPKTATRAGGKSVVKNQGTVATLTGASNEGTIERETTADEMIVEETIVGGATD